MIWLLQALLLWLVWVGTAAFAMDPEEIRAEILTSLEIQGETCEQMKLVSGVVQDFVKERPIELSYTDPETGNTTIVQPGIIIWPEGGSYSLNKTVSIRCSDGIDREFDLIGAVLSNAGDQLEYFRLQYALRFLGFDAGQIDGKWGVNGKEAVDAYLLSNGKPPVSKIDMTLFREIIQDAITKKELEDHCKDPKLNVQFDSEGALLSNFNFSCVD